MRENLINFDQVDQAQKFIQQENRIIFQKQIFSSAFTEQYTKYSCELSVFSK